MRFFIGLIALSLSGCGDKNKAPELSYGNAPVGYSTGSSSSGGGPVGRPIVGGDAPVALGGADVSALRAQLRGLGLSPQLAESLMDSANRAMARIRQNPRYAGLKSNMRRSEPYKPTAEIDAEAAFLLDDQFTRDLVDAAIREAQSQMRGEGVSAAQFAQIAGQVRGALEQAISEVRRERLAEI